MSDFCIMRSTPAKCRRILSSQPFKSCIASLDYQFSITDQILLELGSFLIAPKRRPNLGLGADQIDHPGE